MKNLASIYVALLLACSAFASEPNKAGPFDMVCNYNILDAISGERISFTHRRMTPGSITENAGTISSWVSFNYDRIIGAQIEDRTNHTITALTAEQIEKQGDQFSLMLQDLKSGKSIHVECGLATHITN